MRPSDDPLFYGIGFNWTEISKGDEVSVNSYFRDIWEKILNSATQRAKDLNCNVIVKRATDGGGWITLSENPSAPPVSYAPQVPSYYKQLTQ